MVKQRTSAKVLLAGLGIAVTATLLLTTKAQAAPSYPPSDFKYMPELLVDRRGTGLESIHDFIRPGDVTDVYNYLGSPLACYDSVCRSIAKVPDVTEYWQYPLETLQRGAGDCEDNSFLLTSLIRNGEMAYAVIGWFIYQGYGWGHVWVSCRQCIFDPTLTMMPENPWQKESDLAAFYIPMLYLTESEVYAVPGFTDLFFAYGFGYLSNDKKDALRDFWRNR